MTAALPRPSFYRMQLTEFQKMAFLGRPPSANTIKAAIANGTWAGEKIGGLYFIFVDENGQPIPGRQPDPGLPNTGNPAADALIIQWAKEKR